VSFANQRFRDFLLPQTGPACIRHTAKRAIFRLLNKGVCRYFSASAAATQKTIHAMKPHSKSKPQAGSRPRKTPQTSRIYALWNPAHALKRRLHLMFAGSHFVCASWQAGFPAVRKWRTE
jgi:hypothetical protein